MTEQHEQHWSEIAAAELTAVTGGIATIIATPTACQETDWLSTDIAVTSIQWSVRK